MQRMAEATLPLWKGCIICIVWQALPYLRQLLFHETFADSMCNRIYFAKLSTITMTIIILLEKLNSAILSTLNACMFVGDPQFMKTNPLRPVTHMCLAHCLDILRQRLMCSVDIGVFGAVWVR